MSNTSKQNPSSGFSLERVYFPELTLGLVEGEKLPQQDNSLQYAWDWRISDPTHFEVIISIGLRATQERPEKVRATVCGVFSADSFDLSIEVETFVRIHAPAILFPYVREAISSMTQRGFYSARTLPPINVIRLMDKIDPAIATGAKQLSSGQAALPGSKEAKPI